MGTPLRYWGWGSNSPVTTKEVTVQILGFSCSLLWAVLNCAVAYFLGLKKILHKNLLPCFHLRYLCHSLPTQSYPRVWNEGRRIGWRSGESTGRCVIFLWVWLTTKIHIWVVLGSHIQLECSCAAYTATTILPEAQAKENTGDFDIRSNIRAVSQIVREKVIISPP